MRIAVLALLVLLGACSTPTVPIQVDRPVPILIPQEFLECPVLREHPDRDQLLRENPESLSRLILVLYRNQEQCRSSMDRIREYQDRIRALHLE